MNRTFVFLAFAVLFCLFQCSSVVQAQVGAQAGRNGRLLLKSLPASAKSYVDARPVTPQYASLVLPSGQHLLQVEAQVNGHLQVMRQIVEVQAGETKEVRVWLRRVLLPERWTDKWTYYPIGEAGEEGPQGPQALPSRQWSGNLDVSQAVEVVQPGMDILLDDMQAQVDSLHNHLSGYENPFYLYAPAEVHPLEAGPAGPVGSPGLAGRAGIPGEVALLVTPKKQPLLDYAQHQWHLDTLRTKAADLERRIKALTIPPRTLITRSIAIQVLTPEWKAPLDKQMKTLQSAPPQRGELLTPSGIQGARGRRGPDGTPPANAMPQVLPEEDLENLLSLLGHSGGNFMRLQQVQEAVDDLERRILLAEADQLFALQKR